MGRWNRAGQSEKDVEWSLTRIFQHPLDSILITNIADFVAITKKCRRPIKQGRFGISAGGHHAAFDVNVRVNESRSKDASFPVIMSYTGISTCSCGFYPSHSPLPDPQLAIPQQPLTVNPSN